MYILLYSINLSEYRDNFTIISKTKMKWRSNNILFSPWNIHIYKKTTPNRKPFRFEVQT